MTWSFVEVVFCNVFRTIELVKVGMLVKCVCVLCMLVNCGEAPMIKQFYVKFLKINRWLVQVF